MASVSNVVIAFQSGSTNTVYCTWSSSLSNVDHYEILWKYSTSQGVAFDGGLHTYDPNTNQGGYWQLVDTYDYPSNATHVRAYVKPVSKTHTVNGTETSYWTGSWTESKEDFWISNAPPATPSTPSVEIGNEANGDSKYKLTMYVDSNTDEQTNYMEFWIRKTTGTSASHLASIYSSRFNHRYLAYYYVSPGSTYAVAARGINSLDSGTKSTITLVDGTNVTLYSPIYGEWSDYSGEVSPPPDSPSNPACSAFDKDIVKVTWSKATGATGYDVQYATKREYLESSSGDSQIQSTDTDTGTMYVTGLSTGEEYFFRIRATNDSGESAWTSIVSTIIGTKPEAPTTWSSTTTAMIGDIVNLYWVHNCEDGSDQAAAEVRITPSIGSVETINITDDTNSYALDTSQYSDGTEIAWQVRTAGITLDTEGYGDWSIVRTIKVNSPATLGIEMPTNVDSFPITIYVETDPPSQKAISYYISIVATDSYEVVGPVGETLMINAGDEVFSKLYNTSSNTLSSVIFTISVGDMTLQDGQTYRLTITAAMNTGLTAENSQEFTVHWSDELYSPYSAISIDSEKLVTYIAPYCERVVNFKDGDNPDTAERELVPDVTLAVYRRETDGKFTLIGDGIENTGNATIIDPHPALDYARYRIVAQDENTGQISFEDMPGIPILSPYVVMQWDEDWTDFNYDGEPKMDDTVWSGSTIKIMYNVDVSESHSTDRELVEYAGRSYPVSYYGTQLGESGEWSVEIPKSDADLIYALRRLSTYMGDVYVREPSGIGYWAQVSVSMNTEHCKPTVPVSFTIERVEGGM